MCASQFIWNTCRRNYGTLYEFFITLLRFPGIVAIFKSIWRLAAMRTREKSSEILTILIARPSDYGGR